jgi:hypothetical protein
MCENANTIMISKYPILHVRIKQIEIRHHFIWDHIERGEIKLVYIDIKHQIIDIITKHLSSQQHDELKFKLDMLELAP